MRVFESSDMQAWYQLVQRAREACGYQFVEGLDHYLVLTLQAFVANTSIADNVLAIEYLENISHESRHTLQNIRDVGDQCLLLSGLFPERAEKRNVSLSYYIDLGKNSYMKLAEASPHLKVDNELFFELGTHFVGLMDVLHHLNNEK